MGAVVTATEMDDPRIHFACWNCGTPLTVRSTDPHYAVECPRCSCTVKIPRPDQAPKESAPSHVPLSSTQLAPGLGRRDMIALVLAIISLLLLLIELVWLQGLDDRLGAIMRALDELGRRGPWR